MKKVLICVLGCLIFGIFLIFRPVKNQQQFSFQYSSITARNLSSIKKNTGQELENAVKNTTEAKESTGTGANGGNATVEKAIAAAETKLGTDYIWGAEGPDNFDCSGLMMWAYTQAGINMTRTTFTQIEQGEFIQADDISKWKRGDLLFPHAGHVVMYLGEGRCIQAPQAGEVVKEDATYITAHGNKMYAVRRIVGD